MANQQSNTTATLPVPVKAYAHDGIRRFRVSAEPPARGLNELKRGVQAITTVDNPVLKWQDDDGDFITIAAPPDFTEAVQCLGKNNTLKVFVNGFTPTSTEMESSTSLESPLPPPSTNSNENTASRQTSNAWGSSEVLQNIIKAVENGAMSLNEGVKQIENTVSTQVDTMLKTQRVVSQETLQNVSKKMEEGAASVNDGLKQIEKSISENFDAMVQNHGLQDLDKKIHQIIEEKLAKVAEYGHWNEPSKANGTNKEAEAESHLETAAESKENKNIEIQHSEPDCELGPLHSPDLFVNAKPHHSHHGGPKPPPHRHHPQHPPPHRPHHPPQPHSYNYQQLPMPMHHAPQYPHFDAKKNKHLYAKKKKKHLNEVAESFAQQHQSTPSFSGDGDKQSSTSIEPHTIIDTDADVAESFAREYPSTSVERFPRLAEPASNEVPVSSSSSSDSASAKVPHVYQSKAATLKQMGFQQDEATLLAMLSAKNGNLRAVVEILISN